MTVTDKFGRYLNNYINNSNYNVNEDIKNLIQNFIRLMQQIPILNHHLPDINLNDSRQFRAMSDPRIFDEYEKYVRETKGTPWWFRVWFENKYIHK